MLCRELSDNVVYASVLPRSQQRPNKGLKIIVSDIEDQATVMLQPCRYLHSVRMQGANESTCSRLYLNARPLP